jgi:hypothetical protein
MSKSLRFLDLPPDAMRVSAEEVRKIIDNPKLRKKLSKYKNKQTWADGHHFDSIAEKNYYLQLKLRKLGNDIKDLKLQPIFPLVVNDQKVGQYEADFQYVDCKTGEVVVVDVKGFRTREYLLKKRLMKAIYQIDIVEIEAADL